MAGSLPVACKKKREQAIAIMGQSDGRSHLSDADDAKLSKTFDAGDGIAK